jgi:cytochrome c oxidase assembly protein subunit 15
MKRLALAALRRCTAFIVVVVGAYVRLSDAGLGCPDWPLCYGKPIPDAGEDHRAWKEMIHRWLAGTLGVLLFALLLAAWRTRRSRWLATAISALVVFQAALGMWTVTLLLKPAIVTAHLLGGMTILALMTWFVLERLSPATRPEGSTPAPAGRARARRRGAADRTRRLGQRELRRARLPGSAALPRAGRAADGLRQRLSTWCASSGAPTRASCLPAGGATAIHWSHRMFAL